MSIYNFTRLTRKFCLMATGQSRKNPGCQSTLNGLMRKSFDGDWAKPKTQDVRLICTRFETKTSYNGDWAKPKTQDVSLGLYMF